MMEEAVKFRGAAYPSEPVLARRQALVWTAAFTLAAVWPVLWFAYPAGQDTPNHLARAFILTHPDDPLLAAHFVIAWHAVPDLIWDGFVIAFGRFLDLILTLKLFMLLGLGLTLFGVALLNRQIAGRWTFMPLLGVPFLFHAGYAKGFLAFNVAIGFGLIAIALWRAGSERRWGRRLALAWVVSTLLFFAHLVPWGIYGITLLGLKLAELGSDWRAGGARALGPWSVRLVRDATQALPPLALLGVAMTFGGQRITIVGGIGGPELPWPRLIDARRLIEVGWYLPSLPILGIVALLLFFLLFWRKTLRFDRTYALPIALLVLVFFLIPNQVYATYYIAWRIALGAVLLAVASAVPSVPITAPIARAALGIVLAATLVLSGWQAYSVANSDAERADFAALIGRIPQGDTLFAIHAGLEMSNLEYDRIGIFHFGADAVRTRRIMVQSLFASPAQHPIRYREPQFDEPQENSSVLVDFLRAGLARRGLSLSDYVNAFNWVVVHGPAPATDREELPLGRFARVDEKGAFRLYCRIGTEKQDGGSGPVCADGRVP